MLKKKTYTPEEISFRILQDEIVKLSDEVGELRKEQRVGLFEFSKKTKDKNGTDFFESQKKELLEEKESLEKTKKYLEELKTAIEPAPGPSGMSRIYAYAASWLNSESQTTQLSIEERPLREVLEEKLQAINPKKLSEIKEKFFPKEIGDDFVMVERDDLPSSRTEGDINFVTKISPTREK